MGIIVHLREDRRHIGDRDVRLLRGIVRTEAKPGDGCNTRDGSNRYRD